MRHGCPLRCWLLQTAPPPPLGGADAGLIGTAAVRGVSAFSPSPPRSHGSAPLLGVLQRVLIVAASGRRDLHGWLARPSLVFNEAAAEC